MNDELREMIAARKAAMSATWTDPDQRFGRSSEARPVAVPAMPLGFQLVEDPPAPAVDRSASAKERWAREAEARGSETCRETGEPHRWKWSGKHHRTGTPQKKCKDCPTTRLWRPGDIVNGKTTA